MTPTGTSSPPAQEPATGLRGLMRRFMRDERAETSIEYALIGVGITLVIMLSVPNIRDQLAITFFGVATGIETSLGG